MVEKGRKVLVMDDEDIVADIAEQMLMYLGYEVTVVKNGEEAVRYYREAFENGAPYLLVIMDLNIPKGMGGKEAVGRILEIDRSARVLVSSGFSNDPIMEKYSSYGFCGCIAKPFDISGLEKAIQTAMS